ncbi:MAG: sulfatase [Opitutaceae bacterium]|nr:sulfatase [Opitutaceae bacterium]
MTHLPRFRLHRLLFLLTAGAGLNAIAAAAESAPANVLFIAIDDLNDWVGFLRGHPQAKTPNMDRLAARGVAFANAHCAAPLCCPSRAAIFSGRHPFNSGVYGNSDDIARIAPELVLLPQQLKAHGYRTYGTGKLLHQKRPDIFDDFFAPEQRWSPFSTSQEVAYTPAELPSKATDNPRHLVHLGPGRAPVSLPLNRMPSDRRPDDPAAESFDWGGIDVPDSAMGDTQIVDWAIKHLQEKRPEPFFLGVGFYRPHIPLWVPAKYLEPFPVKSVQLPAYLKNDLNDLGPIGRRIALEPATAGSHASVVKYKQWEAAVAAYLACIYYVDTQIGRLLEALEATPHARDTLIVIWGDHGWHLGEKDHWGKSTGWERATKVPLLVVPPPAVSRGLAMGQTSRTPVSLLDLYPTVLEFAHAAPPAAGLDGQSLMPLLRDPQRASDRSVITTFQREHFSVGDDRWRYIRYGDGSEELYDHRADPNEWTNIAAKPEHAAVKARLAALIPINPKPEPAPKPAKSGKERKSGVKSKRASDDN